MSELLFTLPSPTQVGIALGSNLGESNLNICKTISELREFHIGNDKNFLVSSIYKTAPIDCPPHSPDFLNAVIQLETSLTSHELITLLQKIEIASGRARQRVKNIPRTLDLDLLYHGSIILKTEELILPHPKILEREFVLRPLAEINPHLMLPGWAKTANEYLLDLLK